MLLSQMFPVRLHMRMESIRYCIMVWEVRSALSASLAGDLTDWWVKASGLCKRQLMTKM